MKRRYNNDRGGHFGGNKRPRFVPEVEHLTPFQRLEKNIVNLGDHLHDRDEAETIEIVLDRLSHNIQNETKEEKDKKKIINIVAECIAELPEKTRMYSTLIGILNAKNYTFGGEIVEQLVINFKEALRLCEWNKARSLVKCFCDLVNTRVISIASLLMLLETLTEVTMEDNILQARSDFYVFTVLSALPWVGHILSKNKEEALDQLLNSIESYINKRNKVHHSLRVWYSDVPHPQEEYLDSLWTQITKLRSDKWIVRHIVHYYDTFDKVIEEALQHSLPTITVPPHDSAIIYPYPRVVFRFFDYTDCPDGPVLPGTHSIERFLVEDSLREILDQYHFNRKDCAATFLKYPARNKLPIDYILVEVIFGELFALPVPKHIEIFYGSLLLELCKLQPNTLPPVLAQTVQLLFQRLDTMNGACIDRFAAWFAYHLSNFQFRWGWDNWKGCLNLDSLHPKHKFVRETLVRCMRLSYHQRIADLVPEPFHPLLPDVPTANNIYETDKDNIPEYELEIADEIKKMITEKMPIDEITERLLNMSAPMEFEGTSFIELQVKIFTIVLLNCASKSFTHLFAALGKYSSVLKKLCTDDSTRVAFLNSAFIVWKTHQQLLVVLCEKVVKANIVDSGSVIKWVFGPDLNDELTKSFLWEILFTVIKIKVKKVSACQDELNEERKSLAKFESGDTDDVPLDDENAIPSEAKIEQIEERLEVLQRDLSELLLLTFNRLVPVISDHIQNKKAENKPFKDYWFRWIIGRLQQTFFEFHDNIFDMVASLEPIFSSDIDQHIQLVFKQFRSLRA